MGIWGIQRLLSLRWVLPPYSRALPPVTPYGLPPCPSVCVAITEPRQATQPQSHPLASIRRGHNTLWLTSSHPAEPQCLRCSPVLRQVPGELPKPCSLLASTSPSSIWAEEYGQGQLRRSGSQGSRFMFRLCDCRQGPFSLWALAVGGGHPACRVSSQGPGEVQKWPWIEKSAASCQALLQPAGGAPIWESGAWAWLCDLEQRGLCFSGLSLPSCTVGMRGGWTLVPRSPCPLTSPHSLWTPSLSPWLLWM